jgi:hypothetical protein
MAGERVYRRRTSKLTGYFVVAISLVLPIVGISILLSTQGAKHNRGFIWIAYVEAVFCFLMLPVFLLLGARLLRMRVVVTPTSITAHNLQGKSDRHARREEIESIDLMSTSYGRSVYNVRTPYVKLKAGGGFFLDSLSGAREDRPIKPEQQAQVDEIRKVLGVSGSDAFHVRLPGS